MEEFHFEHNTVKMPAQDNAQLWHACYELYIPLCASSCWILVNVLFTGEDIEG